MSVYPAIKLKWSTPLPACQIQTILRSYVEKVAHPAYDLYAPNSTATFFGIVEQDAFQIYRTRFSHTRPTTIVYGTLRTGLAGQATEVEVVCQLTFYKKLFYSLWHSLLLVMLVCLLIRPVETHWVSWLPVSLLIGGNRVMMQKFKADVAFFKGFFSEAIAAEWPSGQPAGIGFAQTS